MKARTALDDVLALARYRGMEAEAFISYWSDGLSSGVATVEQARMERSVDSFGFDRGSFGDRRRERERPGRCEARAVASTGTRRGWDSVIYPLSTAPLSRKPATVRVTRTGKRVTGNG